MRLTDRVLLPPATVPGNGFPSYLLSRVRGPVLFFMEFFMTTRIIYTLGEIKELLAKRHKRPIECVEVFDGATLTADYGGGTMDLRDDTFIFQVTK